MALLCVYVFMWKDGMAVCVCLLLLKKKMLRCSKFGRSRFSAIGREEPNWGGATISTTNAVTLPFTIISQSFFS